MTLEGRTRHSAQSAILVATYFAAVIASAGQGLEFFGAETANYPGTRLGAGCVAYLGEGRYFLGSGTEPYASIVNLSFGTGNVSGTWAVDSAIRLARGLQASSCSAEIQCQGATDEACPIWLATRSGWASASLDDSRNFTADNSAIESGIGSRIESNSPFSPSGYNDSRLVLMSASGGVSWEAKFSDEALDGNIPTAFRYRQEPYSWDDRQCQGTRIGKGFEGVSLSPNGSTLLVAQQSALFQDGPSPSYLEGSPARLLFYDVQRNQPSDPRLILQRTLAYNVSRVLQRPSIRSAVSFSGIKAALWLNNDEILILENSHSFDDSHSSPSFSTTQLFLLDASSLNDATDVTSCLSLASSCSYTVVKKRFVATLEGLVAGMDMYIMPGDATWGPDIGDGRRLLVTANEILSLNGSSQLKLLAFAVNSTALTASSVLYLDPQVQLTERPEETPLIIGCAATGAALLLTWVLFLTCNNPIKLGTPPQPEDWWQKNRILVMLVAHARNFLVSGAIYGYPALALILRSLGVYGNLCMCGDFCASQQQAFGVISLAGFLSNIAARPVWGYLLDLLGPRIVTDLGMLVCAIGISLLFAGAQWPIYFIVGWALLGFGGSSVHMSNFHLQHLYPGNRKGISATFTITFAGSGIMFTIWQAMYEYAGVPWLACLGMYVAMVVLVGAVSHFLQPSAGFTSISYKETGKQHATLDNAQHCEADQQPCEAIPQAQKWAQPRTEEADSLEAVTVQLDPQISKNGDKSPEDPSSSGKSKWNRNARGHLRSGKFWAACIWYSIGILQFQWYISSIDTQLYRLGDESLGPIDDPGNFKYLKTANIYNSLSGLWWPVSAWLLRAQSFLPIIGVHNLTALIYTITWCIPVLESQTVTFTVQAISRFLLFSALHAFLSNAFPMEFFGILNSVTYIVSAAFTFLMYPLQLITARHLGGNNTPVNLLFGGINMLSMVAIAGLMWLEKRKKFGSRQETNAPTEGRVLIPSCRVLGRW